MITLLFCLNHWYLFKILEITTYSVSTEPFIVSECITICLKAIELFFQNITTKYGVITIHFLLI